MIIKFKTLQNWLIWTWLTLAQISSNAYRIYLKYFYLFEYMDVQWFVYMIGI